MNSTREQHHKKEKKRNKRNGEKNNKANMPHYLNIQYFIDQFHPFFEYIDHKYIQ